MKNVLFRRNCALLEFTLDNSLITFEKYEPSLRILAALIIKLIVSSTSTIS